MNKNILRNMRRFFQRLFAEQVSGMSKRRLRDPARFWSCVQEFAAAMFPEEKQKKTGERGVAFYLGALLNARAMKAVTGGVREKREIDRVHACMYSYSHTKLEGLCAVAAAGKLFRRYCVHL